MTQPYSKPTVEPVGNLQTSITQNGVEGGVDNSYTITISGKKKVIFEFSVG